MGKIIFWIVLVFVVMFALRLYNTAKLRQRAQQQQQAARGPQVVEETMVRCVRCGTYVPKRETRQGAAGPTCTAPACLR